MLKAVSTSCLTDQISDGFVDTVYQSENIIDRSYGQFAVKVTKHLRGKKFSKVVHEG